MSIKSNLVVVGFIAAALFVASTVFGGYFTIDQGDRGVVTRMGKVVRTAEPGLNLKMPFIESVSKISVQSKTSSFKLAAYSHDQQPAELAVSVTWHVAPNEVESAYAHFGGLDGVEQRLLAKRTPQSVKTVFGSYTAANSIQNRGKLNADVSNEVTEQVKGPLVIESVQLENIDFSSAYEQSVEQRMLAEVEVTKLQQHALREKVQAEITVTKAKADAESVRASAQAEADAVRMRGDAEAQAIKAKGDALAKNPALVELTKAERWNGVLPTTVLPNSTVPFIDAAK